MMWPVIETIAILNSRRNATQWKSIAEWPEGTTSDSYGRCRSEDTHDTKEQAEGVCGLLESMGFGGDGQVFPLRTWVEPIATVKQLLTVHRQGREEGEDDKDVLRHLR